MSGKGVFTWPNGTKYEGEYLNNLKHGQGVYSGDNGKSYSGEWLNGKQHGKGKQIVKGVEKEGEWEHGERIKEQD